MLIRIAIALIEPGLISANCYIAAQWKIRDEIFLAAHYSALQIGAYALELAIIGASGIFGAMMVGAGDSIVALMLFA